MIVDIIRKRASARIIEVTRATPSEKLSQARAPASFPAKSGEHPTVSLATEA
jgi:hypothetical protein